MKKPSPLPPSSASFQFTPFAPETALKFARALARAENGGSARINVLLRFRRTYGCAMRLVSTHNSDGIYRLALGDTRKLCVSTLGDMDVEASSHRRRETYAEMLEEIVLEGIDWVVFDTSGIPLDPNTLG
jgi:hypothetical protein